MPGDGAVFDLLKQDPVPVNDFGRPVNRGRKIVRVTTRTIFTVALALALIATFSLFSFAEGPGHGARITRQIDESNTVRLSRNTHPAAMNSANDRGAVSDSFDADHMLLILQRSPRRSRG